MFWAWRPEAKAPGALSPGPSPCCTAACPGPALVEPLEGALTH